MIKFIRQLEVLINDGLLGGISRKLEFWGIHLTPSQLLIFIVFCLLGAFMACILYRREKITTENGPGATGRFSTNSEVHMILLLPSKIDIFLSVSGAGIVFTTAALLAWSVSAQSPMSNLFIGALFCIPVMSGAAASFWSEPSWSETNPWYKFYNKIRFLRVVSRANVIRRNSFVIGAFSWLWLKRPIGLTEKMRREGIAIFGPPGSGKTSSLVVGNIIMDAFGSASAFVVDRKPDEDIVDLVAESWIFAGKKVMVFDPHRYAWQFNPLLAFENNLKDKDRNKKQITYDGIRAIIQAIFYSYFAAKGEVSSSTDHYIGYQERLLSVLIKITLTMPTDQRNLLTVLSFVKRANASEIEAHVERVGIKELNDELQTLCDRKTDFAAICQGLYRKLQFLESPAISAAVIENDIQLDRIFDSSCLLVVKAQLQDSDMGILSSIMTQMLINKTYQHADLAKSRGKKQRSVWFYLDEFARLNIPQADLFAATARSSGGGLILSMQDQGDMDAVMKKMRSGSTQSFEASIRTTIILPGCHLNTCKVVSEELGNVIARNENGREWIAPLMTADQIQNMATDKCLVLMPGRLRPTIAKLNPYYLDRKLRKFCMKPASFLKRNLLKNGQLNDAQVTHVRDKQEVLKRLRSVISEIDE